MASSTVKSAVACYHCGEDCGTQPIQIHKKQFCCDGCAMVYEILNQTGLCDYYSISKTPGINQKVNVRPDKFLFLDDEKIQAKLVNFKNETETHIIFYLPQVHCSSCLWLIENLHRLNAGVISSKVNFERKEVDVIFDHHLISIRKLAELLTSVGYEPYISMRDMTEKKPGLSKSKIYKLGVAGFCFANIMLLNFPDYLGIDSSERYLQNAFRYISLLLSLPVFFYSASEFYISAWKSIRHRFLNIDAPIVFSVLITFGRSLYEILSGTGNGYLDSMSGIVFFMLVGRVLQDKTYSSLSFERDYTSYFPVAVTKVENEAEVTVTLKDIQLNDTLLIHNQELIPVDGILTRGQALIDYSFVTGESYPVKKEMGEIIYAGGKHLSNNIEMLVIKEVAQSYLTKLWNRKEFKEDKKNERKSFVHHVSRYFTWVVLGIAFVSGVYWYNVDPAKTWNAVTSVLIIACPCGLLLSNTFTNGNILRRLARNHFYLRNAQTIETIASVNHIVFDKTGTLTTGRFDNIVYEGRSLTPALKAKVALLAAQSTHPLSQAIAKWGGKHGRSVIAAYKEIPGDGIEGIVGEDLISIGSCNYVTGVQESGSGTMVYLSVEDKFMGRFIFHNEYRSQVPQLISQLVSSYDLSVLSGDNAGEKTNLLLLTGANANLVFNQGPGDKMDAIRALQNKKQSVMMIGDGLNDAGALKQADVGISIVEDNNNFSPASDAILNARKLSKLPQFISLCKFNKKVVLTAFVVSAVYNIAGLFFAVHGNLQPVIAAILMPCSSISILILTFGLSNLKAKLLGL